MNYEQPNLVKGCIYSVIAFFFFALLGIFLKEATLHGATSFQATFFVYIAATFLTTPFILYNGISYLKTKHFGYHFFRAAYGVVATILYVTSMKYIPVVNATLLFNTAPIFIPLFGIWMLRQPVSKIEWFAIIVGFIGVSFVIRPTEDILKEPSTIIALLAGVCLAIAFIYIKKLTPTDPPFRIVYYFFFLSLIMLIPVCLPTITKIPIKSVYMASLAGVCLVGTQTFLTKAYSFAKPSKIGIFQYATVVFVGLIEWWIWKVTPSFLDFVGFFLIAGAGSTIIMSAKESK